MTTQYLLAADVGGTKTDIGYGHIEGGRLVILERRNYVSGGYATLELLVDDFCAQLAALGHRVAGSSACLAVAGPVANGAATLTNLPWQIDAGALHARYGFSGASIVNDFAAIGHGLVHLQPHELLPLQAGTPVDGGARVVVGAGTGLGVALVTRGSGRYVVHPTEAGHTDFAPTDALQDDLLARLRASLGHVSCERVLSGSGLVRIFQFLVESGHGVPSSALEQALSAEDPAGAISRFALDGKDALAARALDVFARAYGAFAGNMALTVLAHGGVYIAGGIAPKVAAKLADGRFIEAFLDKGRFRDLLATMPVSVVMNPGVGLYGAFEVASQAAAPGEAAQPGSAPLS
jgi:glucokinase